MQPKIISGTFVCESLNEEKCVTLRNELVNLPWSQAVFEYFFGVKVNLLFLIQRSCSNREVSRVSLENSQPKSQPHWFGGCFIIGLSCVSQSIRKVRERGPNVWSGSFGSSSPPPRSTPIACLPAKFMMNKRRGQRLRGWLGRAIQLVRLSWPILTWCSFYPFDYCAICCDWAMRIFLLITVYTRRVRTWEAHGKGHEVFRFPHFKNMIKFSV